MMDHRTLGYSLLAGIGIEIGALHNPAKLPRCCNVKYCDAMSAEDARKSFPELADVPLVNVSHLVDLNLGALSVFADSTQDFVVMNHVIEHVANPVRVIVECFRVLRNGGKLAISAPDMRFTFDRNRVLTSPEHLWDEFDEGVTEVTDEHYAEFLRAVHPEVVSDKTLFQQALLSVRERREHAHVWSSDTFQALLHEILRCQGIEAHPLLENLADANQAEYFAVWQKGSLAQQGEITWFNPKHSAHVMDFLLAELRSVNEAISTLRESLVTKCAQVDALTAQMHQLDLQVDIHQERAFAAEKALMDQVWSAELALNDKQRHIENVEAQLAHFQKTSTQQSNLITAMLQSRSWRWTRILRRR